MEHNNNIEIRSDEIRDILKRMPHWFIRWGITVIFGAVAILLLFSWLFRYPDLIESKVVISAENPPAAIKARATGKITGLYVTDGDSVRAGELLAVIENPAVTSDVMQLETYLQKLSPFVLTMKETDFVFNPSNLELGQIQPYYLDFKQKASDYFYFLHQDYYKARIASVEGQVAMQDLLLKQLRDQQHFEETKLMLSAKSFERDSILHLKTVIADDEMEQSRNKWIGLRLAYETFKTSLIETQLGLYQLMQTKANLQLEYDQTRTQFYTDITHSFDLLTNALREWQLTYLLQTPIDGMVSFSKIWASNQNVASGEVVMTIVPNTPVGILGKAFVSTRGTGKVKIGQRVNIKLDNYPYMEYGMLVGKVTRKSPVPNDEMYTIEISLPQDLTTNYNRHLDMQQELWGNCEIITSDLRLIQRVVYPIKALIEKNKR